MSKTHNQHLDHRDERNAQIAAELKEINDRLERLAELAGENIDEILQDEKHVNTELAAILENEAGEITQEQLNEVLYPRGGRR